jgi:hypothetical protein
LGDAPCSFDLSATSQQYFSLKTNQPPVTSQQYFSVRTNQHQPSATSQTNRLMEHTFVAKGFGLLQGIILNKSTQMEAYTYKRR